MSHRSAPLQPPTETLLSPTGQSGRPLLSSYPVALVVNARDYPRESLLPALVADGFVVSEIQPGENLKSALTNFQPELVIVAATVGDAARIASDVSEVSNATLVVLLPDTDAELTAGLLKHGADVVVRDSDGGNVLGAQMEAIGRRTLKNRPVHSKPIVEVRDLVVNIERRQVVHDGIVLQLTPIEFQILALLAVNAGRVMTPVEITSAMPGYSHSEAEARGFVKVHVARLRKKLEEAGARPDFIVNVRRVGYMLDAEPSPARTPETVRGPQSE